MRGVRESSAEEFYSRSLANAQTLERVGRRYAAHVADDPIQGVYALACALGADMAAMESVVWERINIAPRTPQRQFFRFAEALTSTLAPVGGASYPDAATAEQLIGILRVSTIDAFEESLAADVSQRWPGIDYLAPLPIPSALDLEDAVRHRLSGLERRDFLRTRYAAAADLMDQARRRLAVDAAASAIQTAYESDFQALEGYLVESAIAAGDTYLLTVVTRWALATAAVSEIQTLPADFGEAVDVIRDAMYSGLADADAERLSRCLVDP